MGLLDRIARLLGNPRLIYSQAPKYNALLKLNGDVYIHELGDSWVVLEDRYHDGAQKTRYDCDYTRGIIAGIPTMFRMPVAQVEEIECQVAPDRYGERSWADQPAYGRRGCLYRVRWDPKARPPIWKRLFLRYAFYRKSIQDLQEANRKIQEKYREVSKLASQLESANEQLLQSKRQLESNAASLEASERRYRLLAENVSDIIWTLSLETMRFSYISPSVRGILGFTPHEAMAMNIEETLTPSSFEEVTATLTEELAREERHNVDPNRSKTMELQQIRKDGSSAWCEATMTFIREEEGRPVEILGVTRDISERRRAEEERKALERHLRQAQKMEAIATLAGGIAHRFNNALTVITANLDLLEMDFAAEEGVVKATQSMRDSAMRMAGLTGQLLAYARGGKYRARVISLGDFLRDTLPLLEHTLRPGISVETRFSPDIRPVRADVTQLQMVLSALLANASEATETGGRIRIACGNETVGREQADLHPGLVPGDYVVLRVEDNGKGMDEATKSRIFEPFYTTKLVGSGLGMAAVYGIVKNHGGWIQVESEPGKGVLVRILLPSTEKAPEEIRKNEARVPEGSGTILLVEDEKTVSDSTRALLERLGYRVLTAATGKEALHLAEAYEGAIDLVLLDILLPDMHGKDIYPGLMERRPGLKVIVCSGYFSDGPVQDLLKAGALGFVEKPFFLPTLSSKIREALRDQRI